jgi:hypothetical protein
MWALILSSFRNISAQKPIETKSFYKLLEKNVI